MLNIIVSLVLVFLIFLSYFLRKKSDFLVSLSAIGTFCAVFVALFLSQIQELANKPELIIKKPSYAENYIRWADEYGGGSLKYYYVDLELRNIGKSEVKECQPFLTAVAKKENGVWKKIDNWVPVGLRWVLSKTNAPFERYPVPSTICPRRYDAFSLGFIINSNIDLFKLNTYTIPTGQPDKFSLGDHCFEVTAYSSNYAPVVKYLKLSWISNAESSKNNLFDQKGVGKLLVIEELNAAPWKNR